MPLAQDTAKVPLAASWHMPSHCGRSEHPSPRLTHILRPTLWHSCHHTSTPGNRVHPAAAKPSRPNHPNGQPLHNLPLLIPHWGYNPFQPLFLFLRRDKISRKCWCHAIYSKELSILLSQGSLLNRWRSNAALYSCSD